MPYTSGSEIASGDAKIEAVKRQRVDARLVGEFDWSLYQRGYDGGRIDVARPRWGLTTVVFQPTQGGFEDAAGLRLKDVAALGSSFGFRPGAVIPRAELQGFVFRYLDHRSIAARPDNSDRTADAVDLAINTIGATFVTASPVRDGRQSLASARDAWYSGSGATQSRGTAFGFSTRPSNDATDLATIAEGSIDFTISPRWSVNGFLGVAKGGQVVGRAFAGSIMTFAYLENVVAF